MSATNNPTSLGLYIAYSAAMRMATDEFAWPNLHSLGTALKRVLSGERTSPEDRQRLLKAASSTFFFLYLVSAYEHGAKNKRLLADEMRDIKAQIAALNAKLLDPGAKK
jgi:hypothetical protein